MAQRAVSITKYDYDRLTELIRSRHVSAKDEPHLRELKQEIERAQVLDPQKMPANVVTMNSTVLLRDVESNETARYTLTFPADANIDEGKISILAPIGTAIFGYRVGDTISWRVPAGTLKFKIEAIEYQPEAAGHYHL